MSSSERGWSRGRRVEDDRSRSRSRSRRSRSRDRRRKSRSKSLKRNERKKKSKWDMPSADEGLGFSTSGIPYSGVIVRA